MSTMRSITRQRYRAAGIKIGRGKTGLKGVKITSVPSTVKCRLCCGAGFDTTGKRKSKDTPKPVCVRCGGYGSISPSCFNEPVLSEEEEKRIQSENKSREERNG